MKQALQSLRVLDLTRLLPGPYCTQFFADFGADVIKVEAPDIGDYARAYEPQIDGEGAMFQSLNRNKRSIALNLKDEKERTIFRELVKTADVLVESFRPGVMERLGLSYDTLKELNPKLVYCAITGYGQTGPYATYPGHDINYLSYAGLLGLQRKRGETPVSSPVQIADVGGGALMAAIGILVALQAREENGKGQFVDISMTDGVVSWMQAIYPAYFATGIVQEHFDVVEKACYEIYETSDQKYLSVGAMEPKFWEAFCTAIGRIDLIPELEAPPARQNEMKKEIQAIMKTKTRDGWMEIFSKIEACVSPVLSVDEVLTNEQMQAREMFKEVSLESGTTSQQIGFPIKLSDTPARELKRSPKLGEHTDEILAELGYTQQKN